MSLKKIKTVIFDLDGTLLNSVGDLTDAVNNAVLPLGIKASTENEIKKRVGKGAITLLQKTLNENNVSGDINECFNRFSNYYRKNMTNKTKPYNGIIELLKRLKEVGIKTAVLSNKFDLAAREIVKHYFDELIDFTQGEVQGIPKKPDPTACLDIMKKLNAQKEHTIYVGDSDVDIKTAKAAGILSVAVTWGYCELDCLKEADIIIDRVYQLYDIIFGIDFKDIEKNFKTRGFGFSVFESKKSASEYITQICKNKTVGFGGSMTLYEMGIFEKMKENNIDVHWHWKDEPIYMDGEIYITSANGISKGGEIVNIDGACNRVAATLYNTKRCIIVAGTNKLTPDLQSAIERAKNIAAPLNAKRLNKNVPCVKTGKCEDCKSKERICRAMTILMMPPSKMECEIIIICEDLGY